MWVRRNDQNQNCGTDICWEGRINWFLPFSDPGSTKMNSAVRGNGAIQPSVANLVFIKETADKLFGDAHIFSVLAAGKHEFSIGTLGVIMGGNVRVGMEDNLYIKKGQLAKSNGEMVNKIRRIVEELDFEIACPTETRKILGLKGKENTTF